MTLLALAASFAALRSAARRMARGVIFVINLSDLKVNLGCASAERVFVSRGSERGQVDELIGDKKFLFSANFCD
jgi:hypothetical protein